MAEPDVSAFPRRLEGPDQADEARIAEIRTELDQQSAVQELFTMRGWEFIAADARREEATEQAALASCALKDVRSHRDRLGYLRWLIAFPARNAQRLANLQAELEIHSTPEDEEAE